MLLLVLSELGGEMAGVSNGTESSDAVSGDTRVLNMEHLMCALSHILNHLECVPQDATAESNPLQVNRVFYGMSGF